jgi:hypothetical protein
MITYPRHHCSLSITLCFILTVILTWDAPTATSAGQPCEKITPGNFEKLSLGKKIQVSEAIRECERKLKDPNPKHLGSPQKGTKALAYITARAYRPPY